MLRAHIITLFPEVCTPYFQCSILGRAVKENIIDIRYYNPIDEVPLLKRVDSRQYGGGPGMVLKAEPYLRCFNKTKQHEGTRKAIFLTPGGVLFTQEKAKEYAQYENLIFFCGHYEGVDERVAEATNAEHVSIGDYILTGGELPAMSIIDATARELPGILGNETSREDARVASRKVYTRPESLEYEGKTYSVPEVLRSGHHKNIDEYRQGLDR
ncbi:MAG: tRNA (guanosine(37)-N1)-methyltransferase TrmD [Candidatus Kaiserbacteria bacterium]|nr:tRNA (guanosine(37)-N1)-methyltransferase TrmD [Candidatus Kaiserbacteria bacterium]